MKEAPGRTTTRDGDGGLGSGVTGVAAHATVKRVEDCPHGHPLYVIDRGSPEHIIGPAEARSGDYWQILRCQNELDRAQQRR